MGEAGCMSVTFIQHEPSIPKTVVESVRPPLGAILGWSGMWVDKQVTEQYCRESAVWKYLAKTDSTRENTVISENQKHAAGSKMMISPRQSYI